MNALLDRLLRHRHDRRRLGRPGLGASASVRRLRGDGLGTKTISYAASVPSNDSVPLLVTDAGSP